MIFNLNLNCFFGCLGFDSVILMVEMEVADFGEQIAVLAGFSLSRVEKPHCVWHTLYAGCSKSLEDISGQEWLLPRD